MDRAHEDLYLYSRNLNEKSYITYCTYSIILFLKNAYNLMKCWIEENKLIQNITDFRLVDSFIWNYLFILNYKLFILYL